MRLLSIFISFALLLTPSLPIKMIGILEQGSHFKYPSSMFVDTENKRIIVADSGHHRMMVLGIEGEFITTFGEDENFRPTKVIQDKGSRVIVCDPESSKISLFDRKGTFLAHFGATSDEITGIVKPSSVAIDKQGRFLVLDRETCQVKVFENSGEFLFSMGRKGDSEGELSSPCDLALDDSGNIYVADTLNNRVIFFDKTGNPKGVFGQSELLYPTGIIVNSDYIYISDTGNHRIAVYSKTGKFVTTFGSRGVDKNSFEYPTGICLDGEGKIWVADSGNNRIVRHLKTGERTASLGTESITVRPKGLATSDGLLYVAESAGASVNVYNASGEFVRSLGLQGTSATNLKNPGSCCISNRGDVIVADTGNNRIQVYSPNGDHLVSFGSEGSGANQFLRPASVYCGKSGKIIVADSGNSRVAVLSMGGSWEFSISQGLLNPIAVAEDQLERIWVADEETGQVSIFNKNGRFEESLAGEAFGRPSAIAIDELGRVFIVDSQTCNVRVFSTTGYELASFGDKGGPATATKPPFLQEAIGSFFEPSGIAVNAETAFIADTGNGRVQAVSIAAFGGLPKIESDKTSIVFQKVPKSSKRSLTLKITNTGGGLIEGNITSDAPWIALSTKSFVGDIEITITADGTKAQEGQRQGTITVLSNGGILKVPVAARFFTGQVKRIEMVVTNNTVIANGKKIIVKPAPFKEEKSGKVYVPFRFIGEELGAEVIYAGNRIIYILEGTTLQLTIGSSKAVLRGKEVDMGSPCFVFGGVAVVPLRFITESLGATILVDGNKLIVEYP